MADCPPRRLSYSHILQRVAPGSSVLDLGCGDGELLSLLAEHAGARGRGVDIDEEMVLRCIARGLSVFQGDLDEGLRDYAAASYDYVILNQTLQATHRPTFVLKEMLRVGKKVIVSFPNFGVLETRLQLLLRGRMPVTSELPYQWYDTPNIHFCTRKDFLVWCKEEKIRVLEVIDLRRGRRIAPLLANLWATETIFILQGSGRIP